MGPVVVDTNVVLYYLTGKGVMLPASSLIRMSVITEMELLSFPDLSPEEEKAITGFCGRISKVDLTSEIKEAAIKIRRSTRLKLPDAIIAATAFTNGWELLTADKAFARVSGLRVVSPIQS